MSKDERNRGIMAMNGSGRGRQQNGAKPGGRRNQRMERSARGETVSHTGSKRNKSKYGAGETGRADEVKALTRGSVGQGRAEGSSRSSRSEAPGRTGDSRVRTGEQARAGDSRVHREASIKAVDNNKKAGRPLREERSGGRGSRGNESTGNTGYLKIGRIKGEWMEFKLPEHLINAPLSAISKYLPLPPKLLSKLMQNRGVIFQGPNLKLQLFPREERDFPSDWMELNILYEDEFTLIVNKPAGIEVHPSEKGQRRTLAHAVAAYYEMSGQDVRIRHIHRIDKDTTGPVLYAKNEFAHYQYDKAMRDKTIERIYLALAEGYIEGNKGKIDKPIGQDRHHSTRRRISDTGDPAVTHFEVVERLRNHTLVRLRLETGRTHQIRVHLASINHPLAGDGLYGGKRGVISRQALHGERLIWNHPWTGDPQQVRAPLPDDFNEAINKVKQ